MKPSKQWMPIQASFYQTDDGEVPLFYTFEYAGKFLDHADVDEMIAALNEYKKRFSDSAIKECSCVVGESGTCVEEELSVEKLLSKRKPRARKNGWVYLIHAVDLGLFKIGCSKNPDSRLKQLAKQQIPSRLQLVHKFQSASMVEAERLLHSKYASKKTVGEWFNLSFIEVEAIKAIVGESV